MSVEDIQVNYLVHEDIVARQDRTIRFLLKIVLVEFILAVLLCIGFFAYEAQFETEVITVSQEAETNEGDNTLINNSGGLIYGESKADCDSQEESP